MQRASIDITGVGPHTIVTPSASQRVLIHNVVITFAHAEPTSQLVWFNAGTNIEAGPFYVTDGGEIRYKSSGTAIATFRASLTGIVLAIGMGMGQRNQLSALIPPSWYFALRRVSGTTATINAAYDQSLG